MASQGQEPVGSMGDDAALAVLSEPAAVALRLLQAALRPGDEPPDRPAPRGAGDVAEQLHREGAEPPGRDPGALPDAQAHPADPHPGGHAPASRRDPSGPRRRRPRHALPGGRGRQGPRDGAGQALRPGRQGDPGGSDPSHPHRPEHERRPRADPVAARHRRAAPSPDPQGLADAGVDRRGKRRAAGGHPLRAPPRVRRQRDLPPHGPLHDPRARRERIAGGSAAAGRGGGQIRHLGEEGAPQDLQPDGDLHPAQLPRLPDLRGGGAGEGAGGQLFHQHGLPHRRDRAFRDRRGNRGAAPARLPGRRPLAERGQPPRRGRRLPGPGRRRAPPVDAGVGLQAPERDPPGRLRDLQGVRGAHQRPVARARHAALAVPLPQGNPGPPRRGGAGREDPAALRHRGDVVRLHQQGDPRDDRHRDEPDRRPEQLRGRGRGSRAEHPAPERGQPAVPDPAGRLRRASARPPSSW